MTSRATRSPRRRTVIALGVVLAVLAAFVVRLVDIQVVNANDHIEASQEYATGATTTLYGARGDIVDTNGTVLATSTLLYDVQIDPLLAAKGVAERDADGAEVEDADGEPVMVQWPELAAKIAAITGQSASDVEAIVNDALAADPKSRFAYVKRYVSTEEYRALADLGLPFLSFPPHPSRIYPDGAVAGNLVGFVGSDGTPLEGLESLQNACLQSESGSLTYQRGNDGVIIPGTEVRKDAVDGGTLKLTIDSDLQWFMQQMISEETTRLNATWGGVMVVEVKTGKIRAAAESGTVDPNDPGATDEADRGSKLLRFSFEPGSTFKPVTIASGLDTGAITPDTRVEDPDRMVFPNGAVINDDETHDPETLTATGALVRSSNVALSQLGAMVDPQTRLDYLKKFGVGQGTALNWPGAPSGEYHEVADWDPQTYYTTTFGQAFTVTVPQVASVYQTIANGGEQLPLSLVESCTAADGTVTTPELPDPVQVIKPETAHTLSTMLENVFAQGTLAADVAIPGYRMAGKTGTAQITNGDGTGYKDGVYFTSLVGYAPADDPQYVVITVFDEPLNTRMSSANRVSFKKAMMQVLTHYHVMPSNSETPLLPVN
ncbi:peptidoglycan D,D-transpeptidase FtsI family protein [Microbacterium sp.]|uniref:peptidoglycan D,D-transpeptidase FtsI family protein n=1 Tax=Microbacterium sp. TaxID=51671 RepID=UPI0039E5CDAA